MRATLLSQILNLLGLVGYNKHTKAVDNDGVLD